MAEAGGERHGWGGGGAWQEMEGGESTEAGWVIVGRNLGGNDGIRGDCRGWVCGWVWLVGCLHAWSEMARALASGETTSVHAKGTHATGVHACKGCACMQGGCLHAKGVHAC